jgi:hypothetical protein
MLALIRMLRRKAAAAAWHVGRRGACLVFLGLAYVLLGWGFAVEPPAAPSSRELYAIHLSIMSFDGWALVWASAGIACLFGAVVKRVETVGFSAAMMVAVLWGLAFAAVAAFADVYRAWAAAVLYLAFAAFVLLIAGWPEPPRPRSGARSGARSGTRKENTRGTRGAGDDA